MDITQSQIWEFDHEILTSISISYVSLDRLIRNAKVRIDLLCCEDARIESYGPRRPDV